MIFRKANLEDIDAIVAMIADDELGSKREDYRQPLPQVYLDAFKNINQEANQELIVVENEGKIIGCMQLTFIQYLTYQGGVRAQIEGVRIHKDVRSQGIGKQLFEWAIQRSKEKGAHVLQLTTDKKRPEALKFYEDLGFITSHEGMKLHF